MALNLSRKSQSKGKRENSLLASRNGSRNVSITKKDNNNSNIFRVTGKLLNLKGMQTEKENAEQAYQLKRNCSQKASLLNHSLSQRNYADQPFLRD